MAGSWKRRILCVRVRAPPVPGPRPGFRKSLCGAITIRGAEASVCMDQHPATSPVHADAAGRSGGHGVSFAVGVTVTHWAAARRGRCSPASSTASALDLRPGAERLSGVRAIPRGTGIDSISHYPDSVLKTMVAIVEAEKGTPSAGLRAMAETSRSNPSASLDVHLSGGPSSYAELPLRAATSDRTAS